ncbi:hypothetical protein CDL15_Pgr029166 [Punica granatum]|uniref:Uncharacterized protein n=1 Tax=Punica granatum TaxID=22663 RepID=A0A218X5M4_PUNGR|nr:hypothetical protein CDL15_Pgr029166 [Punica granatum]
MHTRASFLSCYASSQSVLARASGDLVGSSPPCVFTFMLRKFAEPAGSYFLQPYRVCSLCEFTFMLCKFAVPAGSFFLRPSRVCSPVLVDFLALQVRRACPLVLQLVHFHASQVHRVCSLVLLANLPGLLTRASLLSCLPSSPSLLARASCDLAGSAHPCEFTFMLRKFAEPAGSFLLRPCRVCSPVLVYFHASQVRRACSLVLLASLPGLLIRASLLSCFASSPSLLALASCDLAGSAHPCEFGFMLRKFLLACASCDLAGSAHPCEFTFTLRKYAEPSRSCFLQPCRVCSPVRVYFHASQVRRACSVVLHATLPDMHTRASLLSCYASSQSVLARASGDLVGSVPPCVFTFLLRKFAEPAGSCFLRPNRVCSPCEFTFMLREFAELAGSLFLLPSRICSPVLVYLLASQVRRACSLVLLATLPGLLTCASLLSRFASTRSLHARASCNLAESAHPCEFTFMVRKFAELGWSCYLQPCRILLARAAGDLIGSAPPCEFTFMLRKFAEPARWCFLRPYRSLLARAFGDLVGSATPCEFTFMLRKSAEPAGSCFLRPCTICTPVRVYFHASQVRRVCSLVLLSNLPGLLARGSLHSCYASSQSLLARASSDLVGSAPPCEFTFMLRKFAKPAGSCFFRPYRVCSPVGIYFHVSQVRRACWLVLLATLPGLLTRTNLLSRFASSPSLLARASCDLTESAHPCEFTFTLRKYAEPAC